VLPINRGVSDENQKEELLLTVKNSWNEDEKKKALEDVIYYWRTYEEPHLDENWKLWGHNFFVISKYQLFSPQFHSFSLFLKCCDLERHRTQITRWIKAYTVRNILLNSYSVDQLTELIQHYVPLHKLMGKPSLISLAYEEFLEEEIRNRTNLR